MLKSDIIKGGYSKLRISGLTVDPGKEDLSLALIELESMMAELEASSNLAIGYNFEVNPNANTPSGVQLQYRNFMVCNLAVRLIADFGKQVPGVLAAQANQSLSQAIGVVAMERLRQVQPSCRSPHGSGNNRFELWRRFNFPIPLPPNDASTNYITEGEIMDYFEPFVAFLSGADIASYTITADDRLTILSDSDDNGIVSYQVQALSPNQSGVWQRIQIVMTTSDGRVDERTINFVLQELPKVGNA